MAAAQRIFTASGAGAVTTSYPANPLNPPTGATPTVFNVGVANRVRVYGRYVLAAGTATVITVKIQTRFNIVVDGAAVTYGWLDTPTQADVAARTIQIEQAFNLSAGNNDFSFVIDLPKGYSDCVLLAKTTTGNMAANESLNVYIVPA
jgi:hypothetical protein